MGKGGSLPEFWLINFFRSFCALRSLSGWQSVGFWVPKIFNLFSLLPLKRRSLPFRSLGQQPSELLCPGRLLLLLLLQLRSLLSFSL